MSKHYEATHAGLVRSNNEDAFAIIEPETYLVADGMGGQAAGEVASNMLVDSIRKSLNRIPAPWNESVLESAIIDAGLIYVTQEEFSEHINDTNPHPNTPTVQQTVTNTDNVLTYGEDNNFHPISLTDFTRQALGGDTADLPQIKSRISQAEVNIANIFMQLKAEEDLGLKPNLLLIDDFDNPTNTDFYRQNVVTSVAGISNVRVVSDVGLHSGSWYTLSDGVHNELVQVTAVAKNGDAHVAIFADDVINTYDLTCTQLYRTTTTPENSIGIGAGDTRSEVYPFTETWQGTSANSSATTYLNTTLANSAAFTLSGSYAFSADGEFTLA